jgi:hypothetical protein
MYRSMKKFENRIVKILMLHCDAVVLLVTLTVPAVPVEYLGMTIATMRKAFSRMRRRKPFRSLLGWVLRREERISRSGGHRLNPHFHVVLVVPEAAVAEIEEQCARLWSECWKGEGGTPSGGGLAVDVQQVRPSDEHRHHVLAYLFKETRPPRREPEKDPDSIAIADLVRGVDSTGDRARDAYLLGEYLLQIRRTREVSCGGGLAGNSRRLGREPAGGLAQEAGAVEETEPSVVPEPPEEDRREPIPATVTLRRPRPRSRIVAAGFPPVAPPDPEPPRDRPALPTSFPDASAGNDRSRHDERPVAVGTRLRTPFVDPARSRAPGCPARPIRAPPGIRRPKTMPMPGAEPFHPPPAATGRVVRSICRMSAREQESCSHP